MNNVEMVLSIVVACLVARNIYQTWVLGVVLQNIEMMSGIIVKLAAVFEREKEDE